MWRSIPWVDECEGITLMSFLRSQQVWLQDSLPLGLEFHRSPSRKPTYFLEPRCWCHLSHSSSRNLNTEDLFFPDALSISMCFSAQARPRGPGGFALGVQKGTVSCLASQKYKGDRSSRNRPGISDSGPGNHLSLKTEKHFPFLWSRRKITDVKVTRKENDWVNLRGWAKFFSFPY